MSPYTICGVVWVFKNCHECGIYGEHNFHETDTSFLAKEYLLYWNIMGFQGSPVTQIRGMRFWLMIPKYTVLKLL